jgi:biopolymer transport protein ExbD
MKLESRLNLAPRFLHVLPFLGVVMLLVTFFLYGSSLVRHSGLKVALTETTSLLPPARPVHTITLSAGAEPRLYFDDAIVSWADLATQLTAAPGQGQRLMLLADALAAHGSVMRASELAIAHGYDVVWATQTGPGSLSRPTPPPALARIPAGKP